MADIEGEDQYDAPLPVLERMVDLLVELQAAWIGREEELLAMRLPDWRAPALTAAIAAVVERRRGELDAAVVETLDAFVAGLAERCAAVGACGLPDTLVHGDYHPGNVRGTPFRLALLDWGDTGLGQPLLDLPAFLAGIPAAAVAPVRDHWIAAWRARLPEADPDRAASLLAPVAAARQATIYQRFVDGIEPVERRHHDADAREWLERCAALVEDERRASAG
jgi:aminoglycoside phosphotransferase (APT) family kinase protein